MFRSLAAGRRLPFHTAFGLTRSLVPKASDTWLAISDRRGAVTSPKPSARASGGEHGLLERQLQAAQLELLVDDAVARLDVRDRGLRVGDHVLHALA